MSETYPDYEMVQVDSPVGWETGTDAFAQTFEAVSVYIDDTPTTSAQGPARQIAGNLFDINRVEVKDFELTYDFQ